jgi:hypothetical protein
MVSRIAPCGCWPVYGRDIKPSFPAKYLKAVTVMLKRPGYDPETMDWFWAKYKADGSLDTNPAGMMLAGKVAKGKPKGCIACHTAAPGGDMMFLHD